MDPTKLDPESSKRWGIYYQVIPATLEALDIANLALFLSSDESKMINGALKPADAGWTAA